MDTYILCAIAVLLTGVVVQLGILIRNSEKTVVSQDIIASLDELHKKLERKGSVTDPFAAANKFNTPGASSSHIVIRKTPDQIRNENFEKIKEDGAAYGDY